MARMASEAKGGYYPTPPEEMAHVCRRVACNGLVNIFDPCAGEGGASAQLALSFESAVTYGVENEKGRVDEARKVLDHVLYSSYDRIRASHESMNCVWLNPPYGLNSFQGRMELTFFRNIQKYVMPGGLFMFCVPQYTLAEMADAIAGRLGNVRVYCFTEKNYPNFQQVVLFGNKRKSFGGQDSKNTAKWLMKVAVTPPEALPRLNDEDDVIFNIPPAPKKVDLFRSMEVKEDEIKDLLPSSALWEIVGRETAPPPPVKPLKSPPSPLKEQVLAVAVAAGAVGGNMGDHIVVGLTEQTQEVEVVSKESRTDEITRISHASTLRVYSSKPSHEGVFIIKR